MERVAFMGQNHYTVRYVDGISIIKYSEKQRHPMVMTDTGIFEIPERLAGKLQASVKSANRGLLPG
jgi:hypothetical protein